MDGGVAGLRISDNADLRSGARPSKKARTSSEFESVGNAADRGGISCADACDVASSPVAGKDSDENVSFSASVGVGANNYIGKQLVFIELCAGSASLSAAAQESGYRVMPVDCKRNRHVPKCRIVQLDLATDHAWEVLMYIVQTCDVAAIHFAPPCGTCSKARGIPLPNGDPGPQVLRTSEFPLGVPQMSEMDRIKTDAANELYMRMGKFLEWLTQRGVAWVLENPTNSFLWELKFFEYAVRNGYFANCHACAWGSTRAKKTSFLSNKRNILMMEKFCHDVPPHDHEPWGIASSGGFATAQGAEYPRLMCEQLVKFVDEVCAEKDIELVHAGIQPPRVHKQPKGRATPQFVSEYEQVMTVLLHQLPVLDSKRCLGQMCTSGKKRIPAGSKLLRSEKKGEMLLCVFGIFHSCEKFVDIARSLWHPFDQAAHMPDYLLKCLFEHITISPTDLVKLRISRLKLWTQWAAELSKDEAQYKSSLDPRVRTVLGSKRLLLMQRLADHIGWPDTELFKELAGGFRIVGNATRSNVFQMGRKAATLSEQQLMSDARFLKPALLGKIRSGGGGEHSEELCDLTVAESTEKSWMRGPFKPSEFDKQFGGVWLPVRRFPVVQKDKLRPIDDLKENRVNDAFSTTERATLYAMDHIVWAAIFSTAMLQVGRSGVFHII